VLSEEAAARLLVALASPSQTPAGVRRHVIAAMKVARLALPSRLAYRLTPRYEGPEPLSTMRLALRATIACRTVSMLRDDAVVLTQKDGGPATRGGGPASDLRFQI
jgi:hypothetical protein